MPRHTPQQRDRRRQRRLVHVVNALQHEATRTSVADARRRVLVGVARWVVEDAAIELTVRTQKRPARLGDGCEAGQLEVARLHELAGVPVVSAGVLFGMGKRSAGPPYRGGKWGGPALP